MNTETGQDRENLKAALLDLGRADYESVRCDLIGRLGYDQFRDMQNSIFAEIGTIKFEQGLGIGARVKFNEGVAMAFVGQAGTVIEIKDNPIGSGRDKQLFVVKLDTPTPAATNWTPLETLAAPAVDLEVLQ